MDTVKAIMLFYEGSIILYKSINVTITKKIYIILNEVMMKRGMIKKWEKEKIKQ